jgi:hypothetical protein
MRPRTETSPWPPSVSNGYEFAAGIQRAPLSAVPVHETLGFVPLLSRLVTGNVVSLPPRRCPRTLGIGLVMGDDGRVRQSWPTEVRSSVRDRLPADNSHSPMAILVAAAAGLRFRQMAFRYPGRSRGVHAELSHGARPCHW